MSRPVGTPNLQVPDPPFVFSFGDVNIVLTPRQVEVVSADNTEMDWLFDISVEMPEGDLEAMTYDDLQAVETLAKLSLRWITKMDREKEKLEAQLEELKRKLAFLQR